MNCASLTLSVLCYTDVCVLIIFIALLDQPIRLSFAHQLNYFLYYHNGHLKMKKKYITALHSYTAINYYVMCVFIGIDYC